MLKPLKKNSINKIRFKVWLKRFIKYQLLSYIIVLISLILCAWIFNRWIECCMFCVAHFTIRNTFEKQFHFNSIAYCLILTLAIIWCAIPIIMPLNISLLSSIPIAFIVCFFGFITQDRIDMYINVSKLNKQIIKLTNELQEYTNKNIYAMSEQELYEHCRSKGLSEEDCRIAYFVVIERLKGKELYEAIGYSERQTKRKRKQILETIK